MSVDIISCEDGIEKEADADGKTVLKSFVDNVTSSDISFVFFHSLFLFRNFIHQLDFFCRHLLTVSPGTNLLSDALISSPTLSADRSASILEELGRTESGGTGAGPGTSNNFEFGVDPSLDPELAIVLFAIDQSDVLNGFFV